MLYTLCGYAVTYTIANTKSLYTYPFLLFVQLHNGGQQQIVKPHAGREQQQRALHERHIADVLLGAHHAPAPFHASHVIGQQAHDVLDVRVALHQQLDALAVVTPEDGVGGALVEAGRTVGHAHRLVAQLLDALLQVGKEIGAQQQHLRVQVLVERSVTAADAIGQRRLNGDGWNAQLVKHVRKYVQWQLELGGHLRRWLMAIVDGTVVSATIIEAHSNASDQLLQRHTLVVVERKDTVHGGGAASLCICGVCTLVVGAPMYTPSII